MTRLWVRSLERRAFIAALAGVAAWPLAGHAQQTDRIRRVGVLLGFSTQAIVTAFTQALGRLGWVEGKNIRIDYRFAAGDPTLIKSYAAELVGLSPDAILGSTLAAVEALRQQSRTTPIVFVLVADPVGRGFVQSLARPAATSRGSPPSMRRSWEMAAIAQGGRAERHAGRRYLQPGHHRGALGPIFSTV